MKTMHLLILNYNITRLSVGNSLVSFESPPKGMVFILVKPDNSVTGLFLGIVDLLSKEILHRVLNLIILHSPYEFSIKLCYIL